MACVHPLPAWRRAVPDGEGGYSRVVTLREPSQDDPHVVDVLRLPCGSCLTCRQSRAREWALRCWLEAKSWRTGAFVTLTYRDSALPNFGSLRAEDIAPFIKRLRAALHPDRFKFFLSGEYGERTDRPHYHALLFGVSPFQARAIEAAWGFGHARVDPLSDQRIAYVAGYCSKKIGFRQEHRIDVDPETGEVLYERQAPFVRMSRRPGIGGSARNYWRSWRDYAVLGGRKLPVPRFLHRSWLDNASPEEVAALEEERRATRQLPGRRELEAKAANAATLLEHKASRRRAL